MAVTRCTSIISACLVLTVMRDGLAQNTYLVDPIDLGSSSLGRTDDASVEIDLSTPFPFYNRKYDSIFVNEDGILTFNAPVTISNSRNIPINDDGNSFANTDAEQIVLIAPFWNEVDTTVGTGTDAGTVYYRSGLTRSSQALLDAETIVKSCYFDQDRFTAIAGVLVTWDRVTDSIDNANQRNSFQAFLVYDTTRSFVIFYFADMQYQASTFPDIMGFNAGDVSGGFAYPFNQVGDLPTETNCPQDGRNGLYVFRVDTERMTSPDCQVAEKNYAFQISPASGPMMGGNRIRISPNCNPSVGPVCVFQQGNDVLQRLPAAAVDRAVVVCIPGPFFVTGDVAISIYESMAGAQDPDILPAFTVKYTIEHPDDSTVGIARSNPTSTVWDTSDSSLTITWDEALFSEGLVFPTPSSGSELPLLRVSVLQFQEGTSMRDPAWEVIYDLGVSVPNSGSFSFIPEPLENVTEVNPWGVIRVKSMVDYPVSLYSDAHVLGYLLHQQYQEGRAEWARVECERWNGQEDQSNDADGMPNFLSNVPPCPCNLEQAELATGVFLEQLGGCARDGNDPACTRTQANNRRCFLSTASGAGAECCYDSADGNLVFSLDDLTGGSSDRVSTLGMGPNQTPYFSHWAQDVVPYQFCCRMAEDSCRTYLDNRWPKDCSGYNARQSAFIFGDPHFVTFDQRRFTFNGIGEYRIMEVANFGFKLYGRTYMATEEGRPGLLVASFLKAVVMQEAGSDTVHVERGQLRQLNLFYKQGSDEFKQPDMWLAQSAYEPLQLRGVTVTVDPTGSPITVAFHTSSVVVVVTATNLPESITAEVIASRADIGPSTAVTGMLGDMDGDPSNDIRSSSGVVYEGDDPTVIFERLTDWRTPVPADTLMFHMDGALKQSDYRNSSFIPVTVTPDPATLPVAIADRLLDVCDGLAECIFDMSVTLSEEAGTACKDSNDNYLESRQVLAKLVTCPFIPSPIGGKTAFSDSSRHYAAGTTISFSCDDSKSILTGPEVRTCQSGGSWSSDAMPTCVETACDPADILGGGADVIKYEYDSENNLRVTTGCAQGDQPDNVLVCRGGTWDGPRTECQVSPGGLGGGAIAGIVVGVLVVLVLVIIVVYVGYQRRNAGVRNLDRTGTKVKETHPSENWGMDDEAVDALASKAKATNSRFDSSV